MGLRFILGRAGSGKTYTCLKEISAMQEENKSNSIIYIVPEQFSLQAEKDIISFTKGRGIMQAQVLSFNRLAYTVFGETGISKKEHITDIGKTMLIRKTLEENSENLIYFKKAASKSSFSQQLALTFSEFFKYGVTENSLLSSIGEEETSVTSMKIKDTALIFGKYKEKTSESFSSSEEALDVLFNRIENSSIIKNANIWIDGFYGFTAQELKIIEKLILCCEEVNVTLTINRASIENKTLPMTALFYEPKETYNALCDIANSVGKNIKTTFLEENKRFFSPSLEYLEKAFMHYTPAPFNDECSIHIHEADNIYKEVQFLTGKILDIVQTNDLRFKDIAILTGDLENYQNIIKSYFAQCGIPYFADSKKDIISNPLLCLIISLCHMVTSNMNNQRVFSFLKTGLTPMETGDIEKLENYVLKYGIKGYKWKSDKWVYGIKNPETAKITEEADEIKNRLFDILKPFTEKIDSSKKYTCGEISEAILSFLDENNVIQKLDLMGEKLRSQGNSDKYYENIGCWNTVSSIMDTMHTINGSAPLTLEEYTDLFESAAQSSKIGIIPSGTDRVIVGDIDRTRLPEIKVLFIIGANDGKLPPPLSAEGIFSETERDYMTLKGISLAHGSKRRTFEEQFVLYSAITKPSEYIYITLSTGTYDGKTLTPSPLVSKIKRIFPSVEISHSDDMENFSSPVLSFHHLGNILQNKSFTPKWQAAYKFFTENEYWLKKTKTLEYALTPQPLTERLSPKTAQKLFGNSLYTSISRLEKFSSCPYYYFADYTLNAKERQVYQLSSPDIGTLFHGVLYDIFTEASEKNIDISSLDHEEIKKMVDLSVEKQIENNSMEIFKTQSAMKYLVKRIKRISLRSVETLLDQSSKSAFRPKSFELKFGPSSPLPPVVIDVGNGKKIILNGQIDRVDVYETDGNTYVKITDYKSGNKSFSFQDIYYGLQLQLLIYIDALISSGVLKNENILPAGIFYFRIKDPVVNIQGSYSEEYVQELITKELKLSGLVLDQKEILKALDESLDSGVTSKTLPVAINKDGTLAKSSVAADSKTFGTLIDYSLKKAGDTGRKIQDGYILPSPYKQGTKMPCDYCPYGSICGFAASGNKPRYFRSLNKDEVISKIDNLS